jgi:hypothetical protein
VNYEVRNVSRYVINDNLDTSDGNGKLEVLNLDPRATKTLTKAQFQSRRVQRHLTKKRLRFREVV